MHPQKLVLLCAFVFLTITLGYPQSRMDMPSASGIQEMQTPAQPGSGVPNLFVASDGNIYLSWIEAMGKGRFGLRFSVLEENGWAEPRTIAQGNNWSVHWGNIPSVVTLNDGTLAAQWLTKTGERRSAINVNISFSRDDGRSWSQPIVPHTDHTPTEHGMVSLLPWGKDQLLAIWLDGRDIWLKNAEGLNNSARGAMSLRTAIIEANGKLSSEALLDDRVCDCCQTGAGLLPNGAIIAYRDRSQQEVRDIAVVRIEDGKWSAPKTLFPDGWQINGCPVNGPFVATQGELVAIAWFTVVDNMPQVKVIFSQDGGKTFDRPIRVDDGNPMGRVSLALLPDGDAVVTWMASSGHAEVRLRRINYDGRLGNSIALVPQDPEGMLRMVRNGESLYFAWTTHRQKRFVQTAKLNLADF